jgi:hopanoid biosynthesis associated RND transporter like protein HpnN
MRERLFQMTLRAVLGHPRRVILITLALTFGAALFIPGLRVEAGHKSMSAADSPHFLKLEAFLRDFGSPNQLLLMVEGGDEALRQQVIARVLTDLPATHPVDDPNGCTADAPNNAPSCVRDVLGRIDLEKFADHGLLFLDEPSVARVVTALEDPDLGVTALRQIDGIQTFLTKLARGIEARGDSEQPEGEARDRAEKVMKGLGRLLDTMAARLEDPARLATPIQSELRDVTGAGDAQMRGIDRDGYFSSADGTLKLAIIRPVVETDAPRPVLALVDYVEGKARAIIAELGGPCARPNPDASVCADGQLRSALTGMPALVADETRTLNRDLPLTTIIALLGVALIFALGFRSLSSVLLGLGPLLIGLVWTLAFVHLAFGSLNLLTSSFVATLLGLGIDFAVHILARYQDARRNDSSAAHAVEVALRSAGPGVLTGGLTTAGAFLALAPVNFKAFSELGIMTAFGVVIVMLATFLLMPAMLVIPRLERLQGRLHLPSRMASRRGVPEWVVSHPWLFIVGGSLISLVMIFEGERLQWNYDITSLLPDDAPSLEAWDVLRERTDYSGETASIVASSEAQAREFIERLSALPSVARVDSALGYLPDDQPAKLKALAALRPALGTPDGDAPALTAVDLEAVRAAAQDLADSLEDARFEAARGGADEAKWLDPPVAGAQRLQKALAALDGAAADERLRALQAQILDIRGRALSALRVVTTGEPLTAAEMIKELPKGLQDRLYNDGRFALYIYPAANIGQRTFRLSFVSDIESVSDTATGFPVTHWHSIQAIEAGFREATLLASLTIFLLLFVDFRRLRTTLLALVPLVVGVAWAWGGMSLLGMSYNPANIIAFPLILGIGVDTGVHILHRWQQQPDGDVAVVVRTTGRAIFLSTATTMVGFGSLAIASHRGMSSLGTVLLLGVSACLVTATMVLPAILALLARRRQAGSD